MLQDVTALISGKVKHENVMSESIVPNSIKSFFYVKKSSHYMFSPIENFHSGQGKPKEMIIGRPILSET